MLEATTRANISAKKIEAKSQPNVKRSSLCAATVKPKCHFYHVIYYCKNFVALPVSQRTAEIRKLCVNCLRFSSRTSSKCTSGQCKICQTKLLHMPWWAADPSINNIDKEVASKATPLPSVLATMLQDHLIANKSCFRLRLYLSATATARTGRAELCWIADRKRISYPRNLWKSV